MGLQKLQDVSKKDQLPPFPTKNSGCVVDSKQNDGSSPTDLFHSPYSVLNKVHISFMGDHH